MIPIYSTTILCDIHIPQSSQWIAYATITQQDVVYDKQNTRYSNAFYAVLVLTKNAVSGHFCMQSHMHQSTQVFDWGISQSYQWV